MLISTRGIPFLEMEYRMRNSNGRFVQGFPTGFRIEKGRSVSPGSEFKKGHLPANMLPIGTLTIRDQRSNRSSTKRAWIKVAEPNIWLPAATWVWIGAFGPIPKGSVIHHLDKNPINDALDNLALVARAGHVNLHRVDLLQAKVGMVFPIREIVCWKCGVSFQGKKAGSLCQVCAKEARSVARRKYKQRIKETEHSKKHPK